tara:strand:+ start:530 stop:646 length:117 start_codon:yes stop_codon:yes gene_type:complete
LVLTSWKRNLQINHKKRLPEETWNGYFMADEKWGRKKD